MKLFVGFTSILLLATPAWAQSESPSRFDRSGFTAGLSIGLGATNTSPDEGEGETKLGLAGLNLDLGGYVTPQLAALVRFSGTQFSVDLGSSSEQFVNAFLGIVGQYWISDQLALEGGVGFAVYGPSAFGDSEIDPETGFAITGRGTYRLAGGWQGSLELTPSFYDSATITGTALLIGYQWD